MCNLVTPSQQLLSCLLAVKVGKEENINLLDMLLLSKAGSKCSTYCLQLKGSCATIMCAASTRHGSADNPKRRGPRPQWWGGSAPRTRTPVKPRVPSLLWMGGIGLHHSLWGPFPVPRNLFGAVHCRWASINLSWIRHCIECCLLTVTEGRSSCREQWRGEMGRSLWCFTYKAVDLCLNHLR